ncbi:MAG TPA: cytochrome P450 [Polyangiales bacterium]
MNPIADIEQRLSQFAQSPMLLRNVSRVMRELAPVAKVGNAVFVFKYNDVVETLSSDTDFGVTPSYAEKMNRTSGAFFLGMEDGMRYQKEESFCRRGFRREDEARIRSLVADTAKELLERKQGAGQLDFVRDFADEIPVALLAGYFGVAGPTPDTLRRWLSSLFWELFLNFTNDASVSARADESARDLRPYLLGRIAEIRSKGGEDTFLGRLVALQAAEPALKIDDVAIARNIGGIVIGALSTQAKAMTLALQELLSRPEVLAQAQERARADDDEGLAGYIFEALRFNPHNPLIVRHAMRPTVVAPRTPHERQVQTGTPVFAMTISASFDAQGFARPLDFDPRRPYADYLHFGYGLHRCFGAQLVKWVLTAALKPVLRLEGLHSLVAPARAVAYAGPFPSSFKLTFSPAGS